MFYLGWIILTGTGVLASIAVFLWALQSGQFTDQGRARYLPLCETDPVSSDKASRRYPGAVVVLLFIIGLGLVGMLSPLVLTLVRMKG
jgi:cbb3-type cytochrome oxidase maturation protein